MYIRSIVWEVRNSKGELIKTFRAKMYAAKWISEQLDPLEFYVVERTY